MPTVYITAPPSSADELARTLVEERLAACVNRVSCDSVYRWDGDVHDDEETIRRGTRPRRVRRVGRR
ncbi:divalent-cation tolerance protein CutA [Haloferax mediterranei ATCC 33500]|uniref:Divalent divalent cation tolerance protein n=1 Tax=Haloferax mediterranei (strain ATCC 33500 / DSM 1411 / JCM 8866 / NBRC 14739 / NCIMB 2177 / R-4) TaxID=523841 RepID=I3R4Z2_HALMT|nr:divalent cation tolerance protein CutA [Haloferax mediterranei]AFK19302.1 divalent divalent cation tolerance protein [Haloferax mediterranei ATCC 33500]AHZ21341.1 divalent divalent cation tolerance protein [Haloferax mediterranei ATCC 33500]EMA04509.1 divalent divalent cation tolerance protein [Haloferax mediterranei ATCC 33500]MDX5989406.1 divalent cation tolerance protein CutA [Haloferax mediterranei ATCC 33500]QCQ75770.1 divalent-cation tolerance protein CutA [Haloferax mediterranei ATCC